MGEELGVHACRGDGFMRLRLGLKLLQLALTRAFCGASNNHLLYIVPLIRRIARIRLST